MKQFFVTGIGTDVGKTVVSAILAEALHAHYWKPIQAGDLDNSDSIKVKRYTSTVTVLEERFRLTEPMSPHAAAEIDGIEIDKRELLLPDCTENLIVEGAGGLMVPFNQNGETFADMLPLWDLPVVVVSRHYLGSINHTLMTAALLRDKGAQIAGFVFVGDENKATEEIILKSTGVPMLGRIPMAEEVTPMFIQEQAQRFNGLKEN